MTSPDRTIGGLPARRRPDPKNLISANRQSPAAAEPTVMPGLSPAAGETSPEPAARPVATPSVTSQSELAGAGEPVPGAKHKMSVYVPSELRTALRATYRATSHLEGDDSFSSFVEKALRAELARRETVHNDGKPFDTAGGKLPSGRPLGN